EIGDVLYLATIDFLGIDDTDFAGDVLLRALVECRRDRDPVQRIELREVVVGDRAGCEQCSVEKRSAGTKRYAHRCLDVVQGPIDRGWLAWDGDGGPFPAGCRR